MLKKYLSTLLAIAILFQNSTLLASTSHQKKSLENYKKYIYKAFSPVKKIKNPHEKRLYLENILDKINQELEHVNVSSIPEEQLKNFSKMANLFAKWRKKISKSLTKKNIEHHLILLSILQTCKYQEVNIFEFLKSGKKSIYNLSDS